MHFIGTAFGLWLLYVFIVEPWLRERDADAIATANQSRDADLEFARELVEIDRAHREEVAELQATIAELREEHTDALADARHEAAATKRALVDVQKTLYRTQCELSNVKAIARRWLETANSRMGTHPLNAPLTR